VEPAAGEVGAGFGPQDCHELVAGGAVGFDGEVDQDLHAVAAPYPYVDVGIADHEVQGRFAEHAEPQLRIVGGAGRVRRDLRLSDGSRGSSCRRWCAAVDFDGRRRRGSGRRCGHRRHSGAQDRRCLARRRGWKVVAGGSGLAQCVEEVAGGGGGEDVEPRSGRVGRMVGPGGAVGVDVPGRAGAPRAEQDTGDGQAGTDGEDRGERGGDGALGCLREKHDWG